jgi:hypothetical protein
MLARLVWHGRAFIGAMDLPIFPNSDTRFVKWVKINRTNSSTKSFIPLTGKMIWKK